MADPWLSGEDRENLDRKFQHIRPIRTIRQSIPVFTEFLKKKKIDLMRFSEEATNRYMIMVLLETWRKVIDRNRAYLV